MANKDRIDLTDDRYREFLNKLAHDDEFREELKRRPREVLDAHGVPYLAEEIPDPVVLMPKKELRGRIEEHVKGMRRKGLANCPVPVFPKRGKLGKLGKPSKKRS